MVRMKNTLFFFKNFLNILQTYQNWPVVLFHLQRVIGTPTYIAKIRGEEKFWVRQGIDDIFILNEIFHDKMYDRPEYGCMVREGDVVVDIGGYIGDFSIHAARLAGKNGHVFCFEPIREMCAVIQRNIMLNDCQKQVTLFPVAMGTENKQDHIFVSSHITNAGSSQFQELQSDLQKTKTEKIDVYDMKDLEKIIKKAHVDVIKIDAEGGEYTIVPGIPINMLKHCRCLMIEYHSLPSQPQAYQDLITYLQKHNFVVYVEKNNFAPGIGMIYASHI